MPPPRRARWPRRPPSSAAGEPDRLAGLTRRRRASSGASVRGRRGVDVALAGGGRRQPAVQREGTGEDGDEEDGDAHAGDDDGADAVLPAVEEGVGVPAGEAGRRRASSPARPAARRAATPTVRPRRPRAGSDERPTRRRRGRGTTMWSSLSANQSAPSRSSSGRSSTKCTSPVMVIPATAASRTTRHQRPSRAGSRHSCQAVTATRRLLWIVKYETRRPSRMPRPGTSDSSSTRPALEHEDGLEDERGRGDDGDDEVQRGGRGMPSRRGSLGPSRRCP